MRTGLVVDSACDLPQSFMEEHGIGVLPISIRIDDEPFIEGRDPRRTLDFYQSALIDKGHDAESLPYAADEIKQLSIMSTTGGVNLGPGTVGMALIAEPHELA